MLQVGRIGGSKLAVGAALVAGGAVGLVGNSDDRSTWQTAAALACVAGGVGYAAHGALYLARPYLTTANEVRIGTELLTHQIAPGDVPRFLEESAVQGTFFHATSPAARKSIIENGIQIGAHPGSGLFGTGLYTSRRPLRSYGLSKVEVAIRTDHPFVTTSLEDFHERVAPIVDAYATRHGIPVPTERAEHQAVIRDALLDAGYDSIFRKRPPSPMFWRRDWLIGLDSEDIKVVVEPRSS